MRRSVAVALAAALLLPAASTSAVEWTVGGGVAAAPDYEGSDDYRAIPVPLVAANDLYHPDTYVVWRGTRSGPICCPMTICRTVSRIHSGARSRQHKVDDMKNGGDSADARRALATRAASAGSARGQLKTLGLLRPPGFDVLNNNGALVTFGPVYTGAYNAGQWSVEARLEGTWASDDYMENAFGVTPQMPNAPASINHCAGFKNLSGSSRRLPAHRPLAPRPRPRLSRCSATPRTARSSTMWAPNQFVVGLGAAYKF